MTFLHVVLIPQGDSWVAQLLEVEIAAQGRSHDLAVRAILKAIEAQIRLDSENGREPFEGLPPAPREFWDAFAQGRFLGTKTIEADAAPTYMFEAVAEFGALETLRH